MAFRKSKAVTEFHWPATIEVPNDGRFETFVISARFRIPNEDESDSILQDIMQGQVNELELVRRIWVGWKEGHIEDDDGTPLPPTPENLEHFLRMPYFRRGLIRAYLESNAGKKAARKN